MKEKIILRGFVSLTWFIILSVIYVPVLFCFIGIMLGGDFSNISDLSFCIALFGALFVLSVSIGFLSQFYTVTDKGVRVSRVGIFRRSIAWEDVKSVYYKKGDVFFSAVPPGGIKLAEMAKDATKHLKDPISLPLAKKEIEKLDAYLKAAHPELLEI